jgi:hypothetical protein
MWDGKRVLEQSVPPFPRIHFPVEMDQDMLLPSDSYSFGFAEVDRDLTQF